MKNEGVVFALKNQAEVEPTAALHKRGYSSQAEASMKVRDAERDSGGAHDLQDLLTT
jgi:hypothetical protein